MENKTEKWKPKYGYKGFDKNLTCRNNTVFEIGKIYTKPDIESPKLCSSDGYHYCNELEDVFKHFSNENGNRFCKIQILGNYTDDISSSDKKSITTAFRIVEEITKEDIDKIAEKKKAIKDLEKEISKETRIEKRMHLAEVQYLQTKYPMTHVGGSTALFLYGLDLKRWSDGEESDLDLLMPYYIVFEGDDKTLISYTNSKPQSNDFDETFHINGTKVDVRLDSTQKYKIIEYKGFKYKVSLIETIMMAKMKYSLNGQEKHGADIDNLLGVKSRTSKVDELTKKLELLKGEKTEIMKVSGRMNFTGDSTSYMSGTLATAFLPSYLNSNSYTTKQP